MTSDEGEVMNNSDNKKWWIGSERDGWEEATYPFSPTPVFGWNPEEGYYGRVFTTDDDRESTINALINIFSSARYCFDADDDAGER